MALTVSISNPNETEISIAGVLPSDDFELRRKAAVRHLSSSVTIDGFRSGHIPEKILTERIGESAILEEMAQRAIDELYPTIITEHKLSTIGRPEIRITKLARGNPLEFTIRTAILPAITLPDYRAIAHKAFVETIAPSEISNDELNAALYEMRKNAYREDNSATADEAKKNSSVIEPKDVDLPALDNAFIARYGSFTSVEEFKSKLRDGMERERELRERDRKIGSFLDELATKADFKIPAILIESESLRMVREMKYEVERLGIKFVDYLSQIKKTELDLQTENRDQAEKRVKINLVLDEIAKKESVVPSESELSAFVEQLNAAHPETTKESLRGYGVEVLTRQATIAFLEGM
ncbi:MAG: hypothetical protein HYS59_00915 [Candidatus Vogelbacteria bacterium]|nr:hypothetical protein [Candidatus Vogelbacteria bacterium]